MGFIGGCLETANTETLLYDFEKNLGDTVRQNFVDFYSSQKCDTIGCVIDSVNYSGLATFARKTLFVHSSVLIGNKDYKLFDGIGSSYGLFGGPGPSFEGSYYSTLNRYCIGSDSVCWAGYLSTGVEDIQRLSQIKLYPNPAQSILYIQSEDAIMQIEVSNLCGQKVKRQTVQNTTYSTSVKGLPAGVYFCKIYFANGFVVRRFMVN